jgi:hypothetical protein
MKIKLLIILIFFLVLSLPAQEEIVTKIRNSYTEYNQNLKKSQEEGSTWIFPKITMTGERMERAIGLVERTTTFYYDYSNDHSEEKNDFIDVFVLRKIIYEQRATSNSYKLHEEYYFDEKEEFLFYYKKSTLNGCGEYRYYFDKAKPVKIKVNPFKKEEWTYEPDDPKNCDFIHYPKDFTKEDISNTEAVLKSAKKHRDTFMRIKN